MAQMGNLRRTHMCGNLRKEDIGKEVILMGWVAKERNLGSLIFMDLRDTTVIFICFYFIVLLPDVFIDYIVLLLIWQGSMALQSNNNFLQRFDIECTKGVLIFCLFVRKLSTIFIRY